jgi:hypothetical protein
VQTTPKKQYRRIRPCDGIIRSRDGKLVNTLGLAQELGLSTHWIRRNIKKADALPHIKVGARILFDVDAVYAWLRAHQKAPAPTVQKRA